jgi:site-specific DNA-methyltransferase (adenine-specific)
MAGRHFTARSQWCLPTAEHYAKLQAAANDGHLRREYEDLRREYEDLRRPFSITNKDQYSDVWQFNTSASEGTLHPAQKPQALMDYIVKSSTRPGDTVLDFVMGSGTTGVACVRTGRRFIGIEIDPGYFAIAQRRIAEAQLQPRLFDDRPPTPETMPLFGQP